MLALSSLLRWNNRLYDRETRQGTWLWASTDNTWWSWVLDALSLTYKYKHYNSVKCSTLITDVHLFLLYFIFVDLGVSLFLLLAIPNLIFFLFNKGHTIWLGEWKKKKRQRGRQKDGEREKQQPGESTSSSTVTAQKGQVSVLSLIQPLPINCPFKNALQSFWRYVSPRTIEWEIWK